MTERVEEIGSTDWRVYAKRLAQAERERDGETLRANTYLNKIKELRAALQRACLLFDQGYTDTALVPEPDEIEWREQARTALEGRG